MFDTSDNYQTDRLFASWGHQLEDIVGKQPTNNREDVVNRHIYYTTLYDVRSFLRHNQQL